MLPASEFQYHIHAREGDVGRYVLLPGDPGRVEKIAAYLDDAHFVSQNREFVLYTGKLCGEAVSVCSTGIGGPSSAIAIEELFAIGADTFVRVGTCGGIDPKVRAGDVVIATGATRQDGTSREYAPIQFPAVPDFALTQSLVYAAEDLGCRFHTGVVQSKDSFYGQHAPERMPIEGELKAMWEAWKRLGVLCSEMESAAQFVVSASLGARCAGLFHTVWNQERKNAGLDGFDLKNENTDLVIRVAIEGIKNQIEKDRG
ncbi:MAG: uridine phosphorylase [Clostridia bacterium]|nr:uridine phosphorylase [Clostridia bacterium]